MVPGVGGRGKPKIVKVFASFPVNKKEIRFNRSKLEQFFTWCRERGWPKEKFEIVNHVLFTPSPITIKMMEHWIARDYQGPAIEFLIEPDKPIRVIGVQPGAGKSFMSAKAAELLGYRMAVIVPAMYVEKWWEDLERMFISARKHMVIVKGLKHLTDLVGLAKSGKLESDVIIVSSTTIQMFLKEWEKDQEYIEEKICAPEKLFEVLGVGTKIVDEFHKGIHLNIKMDQYTHVLKSMYLSATIKSSNPFINRMTEMAYPVSERYKGIAYDRYIGVTAIEYRLRNPKAFRWMGKKGYSQTTYEQSIMRNRGALEHYTQMMIALVKDTYLECREKGQTCLVFAGFTDMCTHLTKALKKAFPKESIARYIAEDPFSNLLEHDIVVSTILSAGTAIDKYGLVTVLMSNGVDSIQSNEQTMGRLRRLKDWPNVTPKFYYLVCGDIPQHIVYHQRKVKLLEDKALWQRYEISSFSI